MRSSAHAIKTLDMIRWMIFTATEAMIIICAVSCMCCRHLFALCSRLFCAKIPPKSEILRIISYIISTVVTIWNRPGSRWASIHGNVVFSHFNFLRDMWCRFLAVTKQMIESKYAASCRWKQAKKNMTRNGTSNSKHEIVHHTICRFACQRKAN